MKLYIIAHKCRGERAFDVAERMECPLCEAAGCPECLGLGFWWIIPTSGHRAYPYDAVELETRDWVKPMPADLRDHYIGVPEPMIVDIDLKELGLL